MRAALKRTVAAEEPPVSLTDIKEYLRQDYSDQDNTITRLIAGATAEAEKITGRSLMPQTWVLGLPCFPSYHLTHGVWSPHSGVDALSIKLPRSPLISVDSITYLDPVTGDEETLDPSVYQVDDLSEPPRIAPAFGQMWPATQEGLNAVRITFQAGYTDEYPIPETVIQAIYLTVASWFENREDITVGAYAQALPRGAEYLLGLNKVSAVGYEVAE